MNLIELKPDKLTSTMQKINIGFANGKEVSSLLPSSGSLESLPRATTTLLSNHQREVKMETSGSEV